MKTLRTITLFCLILEEGMARFTLISVVPYALYDSLSLKRHRWCGGLLSACLVLFSLKFHRTLPRNCFRKKKYNIFKLHSFLDGNSFWKFKNISSVFSEKTENRKQKRLLIGAYILTGTAICAFSADSWSRNGSSASSKVLQVYLQIKQNQHTSAGRALGWAYIVVGKYRATAEITWERCCSVINNSTQEQKPRLRTSTIRFPKCHEKIFWIRDIFWFLSVPV